MTALASEAECQIDFTNDVCVSKHTIPAVRLYNMMTPSPSMPRYLVYDTSTQRLLRARDFDIVHKALLAEWASLQRKHLGFYGKDLPMWPVNDLRPKLDTNGSSGYKFFGFAITGRCAHVLPVRIITVGQQQHIQMRFDSAWRTMEAWLSQYFDPGEHQGEQTVKNWYVFNRKSLPFLELPAEIRRKVYSLALFPEGHRIVRPHCGRRLDRPHEFMEEYIFGKSKHNLELLRVNRQLHYEAGHMYFSEGNFQFWSRRAFTTFINTSGSRAGFKFLSTVNIYFSLEDLYRVFGAQINKEMCFLYPEEGIQMLARLPNLKHFGIAVPVFRDLYSRPHLFRAGTFTNDPDTGGCQAVAVAALIKAAVPALQGGSGAMVTAARLFGQVKDYQAVEFRRRIAAECAAGSRRPPKDSRKPWEIGPLRHRLGQLRNSLPAPFWERHCNCVVRCDRLCFFEPVDDREQAMEKEKVFRNRFLNPDGTFKEGGVLLRKGCLKCMGVLPHDGPCDFGFLVS